MYWGLTLLQHPGQYRGGEDDGEMSVSPVEETGTPGGKLPLEVSASLLKGQPGEPVYRIAPYNVSFSKQFILQTWIIFSKNML